MQAFLQSIFAIDHVAEKINEKKLDIIFVAIYLGCVGLQLSCNVVKGTGKLLKINRF